MLTITKTLTAVLIGLVSLAAAPASDTPHTAMPQLTAHAVTPSLPAGLEMHFGEISSLNGNLNPNEPFAVNNAQLVTGTTGLVLR